ncbi:VirB6/TrbL-like conjugal transfer protein, CD1112 family [Clostridium sp. MD294]|uniref:VirB6/TrbL-like conjugal transfer protein, CD1112 family n=1 Tax=Clostridium sp. MD294 TaxID=97138 RepID=UPI0002C9D3FD|nr:CD0415/CD1112 family protein [Clostridium sp. MD294]NDO47845.1 hypothetical protein [Clostridium sp. MD294]USF29833.1 hypothetical protein C820_001241 [Clostridium sp. MD294]
MQNILEQIEQWIKEFLIDCITGNLTGMFDEVNSKVGEIAAEVGKTPQSWNSGVFSMIQNLSEAVIIPIAGLIVTFVLCYELISMIIEKNNLHGDFDTFQLFKWIFKTFVATYIVTHTFDIVIAIFELSQNIVNQSAGVINGNTAIDFNTIIGDLTEQLESMEVGELFLLLIETSLVGLTMNAVSICVTLVLLGRMIEIYVYCSIGAIPFSTMTNREWGSMGNNYLKGLVALGLQGFFIMVCVAIYTVLVQSIATAENLHIAIWTCAGYTVLLCYSLFKTGSVSKSILNAH